MVEDYLLYKNTINNDLKHKLIDSYLEHKSIKKLCKLYPRLSKSEIQRHLITTIRLPDELQELESSLHSNPNLSKIIACFATDHHNWDGQKSKKDKVVSLALSIAKYLDTDKQINLVFQGIKAPDNLVSISVQRDKIHEKYSTNYNDEWKNGEYKKLSDAGTVQTIDYKFYDKNHYGYGY